MDNPANDDDLYRLEQHQERLQTSKRSHVIDEHTISLNGLAEDSIMVSILISKIGKSSFMSLLFLLMTLKTSIVSK